VRDPDLPLGGARHVFKLQGHQILRARTPGKVFFHLIPINLAMTPCRLSTCTDHNNFCFESHHVRQAANFSEHAAACKAVKKGLALVDKEEVKLRDNPPWMAQDGGDPFVACAGHFWGLLETRDYMRARARLIEALVNVGIPMALETACHHILDCL
jgi:hypothetical protein